MPYDVQDVSYDDALTKERVAYYSSVRSSGLRLTYRDHVKRVLDIALILAGGIVVLPVVVVMAALVALDGHNPFYTQTRVGKGSRRFKIFKIRTMVPNADKMLEEHLAKNPELKAEWDATQKLKNDVRITTVGRILRKTSLDELPQLWNVLNGSMSLVGPRPMMLDQQALYPGQSYYRLRPGITGFWQISDRNDCEFRDRAVYDDQYDKKISLWTDLSVLARTVRVVVRGTGY